MSNLALTLEELGEVPKLSIGHGSLISVKIPDQMGIIKAQLSKMAKEYRRRAELGKANLKQTEWVQGQVKLLESLAEELEDLIKEE